MKPQIAKLLKFTVTGNTLYFSQELYSNSSVSGYESPLSFRPSSHRWAEYEIAAEGIPVLDIRAAVETKIGRAWVYAGPMVDCGLADGAVDACPKADPFIEKTLDQNFYGLIALNKATRTPSQAGALDSVSVAEYVRGWKIHGARVGRLFVENENARIEWNDPVPVEQIPSPVQITLI